MGYQIEDALGFRSTQQKRAKRRRARRILLAVVAVGAVGGGAAALALRPEQDHFASPERVELPPLPDNTEHTREFLRGEEGRHVVLLVEATRPLVEPSPTPGSCAASIEALDDIGSPEELFAAAAGIPDKPTGDMAVNHLRVTTLFLGRCLEQNAAPNPDEVRFTATVLARRLKELG